MVPPPNQDLGEIREFESRFIDAWHLSDDFFARTNSVRRGAGIGSFRLRLSQKAINQLRAEESRPPSIDALLIRKSPRFGNAVNGLIHALAIARNLGAGKIYCPQFILKKPRKIIDGIEIVKSEPGSETVLESGYLFSDLVRPLLRGVNFNYHREKTTPEILELFGVSIKALKGLPEDDLVIHIRSGDIFELSRPNRNYGQPPLAFYKEAIASRTWALIHLVFENRSNPVIPELEKWLRFRRIPFEICSSDIASDVSRCFQARNLVISKGTFMRPVLSSSRHLATLFYWEQTAPAWIEERPLSRTVYGDPSGRYQRRVLADWRNSRHQRREMLRFPRRNLSSVTFPGMPGPAEGGE